MKAYVKDLNGKYYGTEVVVEFGDELGERAWYDETSFKLWFSDGEPSIREIESWGFTQEQWDNNEWVDNGWDGKSPIKELDMLADGHYESRSAYKLAQMIVEALDGKSL